MAEAGCTHGWDWRKYGSCPMCADATKTLEDLRASIKSYPIQPPSWLDAIDAAIHERDELRESLADFTAAEVMARKRAEKAEAERDELRAKNAALTDELLHVPSRDFLRAVQHRAEKAEAEIAALKARIAASPRIFGFSGPGVDGCWLAYPGEHFRLVRDDDV